MIGETPDNAVHVKLEATEISIGRTLFMVAVALTPVALAILMQKPALRQAIAMRLFRSGEVTTGKIAKQFGDISAKCRLRYDLARM